jgi:hypothetical protein
MKLFMYLNIFPFGPAEATAVLGGGGVILVRGHVNSLVFFSCDEKKLRTSGSRTFGSEDPEPK